MNSSQLWNDVLETCTTKDMLWLWTQARVVNSSFSNIVKQLFISKFIPSDHFLIVIDDGSIIYNI